MVRNIIKLLIIIKPNQTKKRQPQTYTSAYLRLHKSVYRSVRCHHAVKPVKLVRYFLTHLTGHSSHRNPPVFVSHLSEGVSPALPNLTEFELLTTLANLLAYTCIISHSTGIN